MKFAILAAGNIANCMAEAISGIDKIEKYAVACRELSRAKAFAEKWGFTRAYGSYETLKSSLSMWLLLILIIMCTQKCVWSMESMCL